MSGDQLWRQRIMRVLTSLYSLFGTGIDASSREYPFNITPPTPADNSHSDSKCPTWNLIHGPWSMVLEEGSAGLGPVVDITHQCPATLTTRDEADGQAWLLTWSMLDAAVKEASSGIGLLALLPEGTRSSWPSFLMRLRPAGARTDISHTLSLEAHGMRSLMTLPLHIKPDGTFALDFRSPTWHLVGTVGKTVDGLVVSLSDKSMLNTPLGPGSLEAVTLTLPGYDDDSQ